MRRWLLGHGDGRRPTAAVAGPGESTDPQDPGHRLAQAVSAGPEVFAQLLGEPGFLAAADPETLCALLWAAGPQAYDAVRVYRRVRPLLGADANANAAYLGEAARALTGSPLPLGQGVRPMYRTRLASVRRDNTLLTLTGHTALVGAVAFGTAPDGRLLLASCADDHTVRLWDPVAGSPVGVPLTGHTGHVFWVEFGSSPDGRFFLASCGGDETVRLWDPLTGAPLGGPLTGHTGGVNMVAFGTVTGEAGEGRWLLASGGADRTVRLWDPLTGEAVGYPLTGHGHEVWSLAFVRVGGRLLLVTSSFDDTIRFWDPLTRAEAGDPLTEHLAMVMATGTAPDGRVLLATGTREGKVRVWDVLTRTVVCGPLAAHLDRVGLVAFATSPDGQFLLASSGLDESIRLWEPLTGTPVGGPLDGHTGYGYSLAFGTATGSGQAGEGRLLLASSSAKAVLVWDPLAAAQGGQAA
ncbi:MAG TPA: WD40 repeat domain-containing protein [Streptosporangiaceae bacterium]|nr:WD40 repeat domain-containing protein [Streptosporangiaceae bacterium]